MIIGEILQTQPTELDYLWGNGGHKKKLKWQNFTPYQKRNFRGVSTKGKFTGISVFNFHRNYFSFISPMIIRYKKKCIKTKSLKLKS